jgi:hypothetical protein
VKLAGHRDNAQHVEPFVWLFVLLIPTETRLCTHCCVVPVASNMGVEADGELCQYSPHS